MTPEIVPLRQHDDWQDQLRNAVNSASELLELLDLQPTDVGYSAQACGDFPLRVPLAFVRRMRVGDPQDPLLRQVLPVREELLPASGYSLDPVGESGSSNPARGIIHKYRGRVLLLATGACAVHCRYCFRRHFPYADNQNSRREWREAMAYIAADPEIDEVILSGGDPLVAGDEHLGELVRQIAALGQIKRLRVHTRLPVVIPDRVTPGLLNVLRTPGLQTVLVIHCNHANELDGALAAALGQLAAQGITLLNQAVLLAGVNDSVPSLVALSERLFEAGVLPYYLHLLDRVQGAAHFDVAEQRARELHAGVTARLPGYLVPRLVREVAGSPAKVVVG